MNDSLYEAILNFHAGRQQQVQRFILTNYKIQAESGMNQSDRYRRALTRFEEMARKYRPVGNYLVRIKDNYTVITESEVDETLEACSDTTTVLHE